MVTIRPDYIEIVSKEKGDILGKVMVRTFLGKAYQYEVQTDVGILLVNSPSSIEIGTPISLKLPAKHSIVL